METNIVTTPTPSSPPTVPWGIRDVIFAIILAAVGIVVLNLVALGISLALHISLKDNQDLVLLFVVVQDLVVVTAAFLFSIVRYRVGWDRLGLRAYAVPVGCTLAVVFLIGSYVVRIAYGLILKLFGYSAQPQQVLSYLDLRGAGFILSFIAAAIVAPIAEEIFFRGFMYGGLRRRIGVIGAMVVSTLFFTALHLSIDLFVPIFVLGISLAWLYEATGSLYPGILLHATNNALSLILLLVLQSTGQLPQ